MNTIWNQYQQGIATAQSGWMYESKGFVPAAMTAYQQAAHILFGAVPLLSGPSRTDALFHLGASELRLGGIFWQSGNAHASRSWLEAALPNLNEVCRHCPGNFWYQQARDQARMMLDQMDANGNPSNDWDPSSIDWRGIINDLFNNGMDWTGMGDPG